MTKKEKVKAFFNKHKKGFIVGSVGLVTTIVGLVAYDKGWKDGSHSDYARVKTILESAIARSYAENKEVECFAISEDDNNLLYKSTVKVSTECIGD